MTSIPRDRGACSISKAPTDPPAVWQGSEIVNEAISRDPRSIAVFNRFGIDACCGGGASIADAAARDDADVAVLLAALNAMPLLP